MWCGAPTLWRPLSPRADLARGYRGALVILLYNMFCRDIFLLAVSLRLTTSSQLLLVKKMLAYRYIYMKCSRLFTFSCASICLWNIICIKRSPLLCDRSIANIYNESNEVSQMWCLAGIEIMEIFFNLTVKPSFMIKFSNLNLLQTRQNVVDCKREDALPVYRKWCPKRLTHKFTFLWLIYSRCEIGGSSSRDYFDFRSLIILTTDILQRTITPSASLLHLLSVSLSQSQSD